MSDFLMKINPEELIEAMDFYNEAGLSDRDREEWIEHMEEEYTN